VPHLPVLTLLAALGSGIVSGGFLAFSNANVGAGLYLVGAIGITVVRGVPLNDKLSALPWPDYERPWTR
jgi:uncharacterized membrane protein